MHTRLSFENDVAHSVQQEMTELLMENKLENIWKEAAVA
jgi:hypothetical protein